MIRPNGYYWIRSDANDGWQPAQWVNYRPGQGGAWWLCGSDVPFTERDGDTQEGDPVIDEVGARIER